MIKPVRKPNGGDFKKGKACSYQGILDEIASCLEQVSLDNPKTAYAFERACNYAKKAEILIEVLEVHNCGSVGGYDKGQPFSYDLLGRYEWLVKKCPKKKKI